MIIKQLPFELKYQLKQGGFWLAAFCLIWMAALITSQRGSSLIFANSSFAITQTFLFIAPNIIFVICVLASGTLLRDSQYKMESLIFTTPIDKFHYLVSRFLGIAIAAALLMLMVMFAMIATLPFLDSGLIGPFSISSYLVSYAIFILPAILLSVSIVFATAMLTKNSIAIYVAGIVLYVLYMIGSVLGNSPLIAGSSTLLSASSGFSSLLEPYGLIAYIEQSTYWSSEQRNTMLPMLSGNLLFNRLLWLAVSVVLFVVTYKRFSFSTSQKPSKNARKNSVDDNEFADLSNGYLAVEQKNNFDQFNVQIWFSKLKLEYLSLVKGKTFTVLIITTIVFTLANLTGTVFSGPINNGQPFYPATELLLEYLRQPLSDIGMLVAIFYTVELYWHERTLNINSLIDTTPTKNLTFYLAKLTTVLAVCFTLVVSSILAAIAFQVSQGYWDIQLSLYSILFYYAGVPILLASLLAFSLQRLAANKALGLLLAMGFFITNALIKNIGFEHPLTVFAYTPQFIFSQMADTIYHDDAVHWYNLYWLSFGAMLAMVTVKFWQRGTSTVSQTFTKITRTMFACSALVFVCSGSYIYYQINVFNDFFTEEQTFSLMENYERSYRQYQTMPLPTVTDILVDVDIYPSQRRYAAKGRYIVVNQTDEPIQDLLISMLRQPHIEQAIKVAGAGLTKYDDVYQSYFFNLDKPLMPNEQRIVNFEFSVTHNAFASLDGEHYVTKGGAYIELEDIMPVFGFDERYVITDEEERAKRNLTKQYTQLPSQDMRLENNDWVNFETTVSTEQPHRVVTVGKLLNEWTENGRHYFHYKTDNKVQRQLAYISAEFSVETQSHNGVEISIYHHPEHNRDNQFTFDALKQTMDYFADNYQAYHSDQFTVVELPYFSSAQSFGSAQPGMYLGVENRFFNLDNTSAIAQGVNPLLRGVSHEFAHQYWGGYIDPNDIAGARMLTETLCKYTELVIAEKLYGKYSTNLAVNLSIERYLSTRPYSKNIETPLYTVGMEPHIFYAKGKQSMHALLDLLGEDKVNLALKSLLQHYRYPKKPTSLDLLNELYQVANEQQIALIEDLFKRVVFHEFEIHSATSIQLVDGNFETTIAVSTEKFVLDTATNKEQQETINDDLDIALYSGFPEIDNANMLSIEKVHFNGEHKVIKLISATKPSYVQIDPNRFRIDRNLVNNVLEVQ